MLRWHRDLFRCFWRHKSRKKERKSRIAPETIALIKKMAKENHLWGAERIRRELLKLDIEVSKRTIQKYMPKARRQSGQTWVTFLKNHAGDIWACDTCACGLAVVHDLLFRAIFVFVIIELQTRRIVHIAATSSPTDAWVAQQLREATPWSKGPKYLDHTLVLHRDHLSRVIKEYADYFNRSRPHQGIGQRIPAQYHERKPTQSGSITAIPVLGGLHHSYAR